MTFDDFLQRFNEASMASVDERTRNINRALYNALLLNREVLAGTWEVGLEWFHKSLRQTDVIDSAQMDMILWHLLSASDLFWEVAEGKHDL